MKYSDSKLYTTMFVITMLLLFASGLQRKTNLFRFTSLSGVIETPTLKKLNFKNYYDFSFQNSLEKVIETSFGFREPLIRLYNQYIWDFYKKSTPNAKVFIGKNNWFFPNWHLKAVSNLDQVKHDFNIQARCLSQVSEIFKEYDTHILVGLIPSKTEIYSEYLTDNITITDNFDPIAYYSNKFDEYSVNYIDFTNQFYSIKDTAIFKPFPQTGTHWSNIMSVYAIDSIYKTFEAISGKSIVNLNIGTPYTGKTREPDDDLEKLLNLFRPVKQDKNYYVDVEVIRDTTINKPKMITIGDSHYWNIFYNIPLKEIFSTNPYWYYGNTIYFDNNYKNVSQVNIINELINTDYVLILYSYYQTYSFVSNFNAATLLISLCIEDEEYERKLESVISTIKSSESWLKELANKANKNNTTLEETISNDAKFLIRQNPYKYFPQLDIVGAPVVNNIKAINILKTKEAKINTNDIEKVLTYEDKIYIIMEKMYNSEEWMESLKNKAQLNNKSLEDVMRNDAIWIIEKGK